MLRNYLEILFHEIKYSNHSYGLSHMDWYLSGWLNNEFFSGDIIANKAAKKSVERLAFHTKLITGPVNRDTPSYTEAKLFFSGKSCFMLKIFHHFREEIFKWWLFNIFASLKESWKDYILTVILINNSSSFTMSFQFERNSLRNFLTLSQTERIILLAPVIK